MTSITRNSEFKLVWEETCGVKVSSRDAATSKVVNAVCLFCRVFGREDARDAGARKRKRTKNIQSYRAPFRLDVIKRHNQEMHPEKWSEYQQLSSAYKKQFFESQVSSKISSSMIAIANTSIERRQFQIDKDIVEKIMDDLLFVAEEDDEIRQTVEAMGFDSIDDDTERFSHYQATIPNYLQFLCVVKFVGAGLSFRQVSQVMGDMKESLGLHQFGNVSRPKVTRLVRICCANSFQIISEALKHVWAFSIALDGGNKFSVPYLDFRLRFVLQHTLFNVHLCACPMYESHTGDNMTTLTCRLLDVLCADWKNKLIAVTTDGASNMTGCHVGLVTQLQRLSKPGFYRVWCAAHQLDLLVQDGLASMFDENFVHVIQGITGHLRRQKNLIAEMHATCPRFINTRWLSMGRLLNWLYDKRRDVLAYFEDKNPPCRPAKEWWIEMYALKNVVNRINITFKELQGQQLLLDEQQRHLSKLRSDLMR